MIAHIKLAIIAKPIATRRGDRSQIGLGLGRMLMERLIEWCRDHGVLQLWGDVLEDNRPMLELATELGFRRQLQPDSPGLIRVSLDLRRKPSRRPKR